MKLYADYIKETFNTECIVKDYGFYTYKVMDNMVYLENVFIVESARQKGYMNDIMQEIETLARECGKNTIVTTLCKNATDTVQNRTKHVCNKLQFIQYEEDTNMIYFYKELI